jgi:hypothetical protein
MAIKEISEKDKPFILALVSVGLLIGELVMIGLCPALAPVIEPAVLPGTFTLVVSAFSYYLGKKD